MNEFLKNYLDEYLKLISRKRAMVLFSLLMLLLFLLVGPVNVNADISKKVDFKVLNHNKITSLLN